VENERKKPEQEGNLMKRIIPAAILVLLATCASGS
jgi:hypothetical protein